MKRILIITSLALSLISCGGQSTLPPSTDTSGEMAPVNISFLRGIASDRIDQIIIEVSGPDITDKLSFSFPANTESTHINVPIGANRTFRAYALFSGNTHAGYVAEGTTDITPNENILSLSFNFLNGVYDATNDEDPPLTTALTELPDIASAFIIEQNLPLVAGDSCTGRDVVKIDVDFDDPLTYSEVIGTRNQLNFIIEFDVDGDPLTGRPSNVIEQNKDTLEANFASGADFHILGAVLLNDGSGEFFIHPPTAVGVYEGTDLSSTASTLDFSPWATYDRETNMLSVCMNTSAFQTLDPDSQGRWNMMVGTQTSTVISDSITGSPRVPIRIWTDLAYRSGSILYDLNFNYVTTPPTALRSEP